jgi:hypothetical protein
MQPRNQYVISRSVHTPPQDLATIIKLLQAAKSLPQAQLWSAFLVARTLRTDTGIRCPWCRLRGGGPEWQEIPADLDYVLRGISMAETAEDAREWGYVLAVRIFATSWGEQCPGCRLPRQVSVAQLRRPAERPTYPRAPRS